MSDAANVIFRNRKADFSKLAAFGFLPGDGGWEYTVPLPESGFTLSVRVAEDGSVSAGVTDPVDREPYTLHLDDGAVGSFVGGVRLRYEEVLSRVAAACFYPDVFKSRQARELIDHVKRVYGDDLEFLWSKFPDNAVWRRRDTKTWYAALLTVQKSKLGLPGGGAAEIIDLRLRPELLDGLIDNEKFFPGYHMNKKHWYTVVLDGSVPAPDLCRRIEESYILAAK